MTRLIGKQGLFGNRQAQLVTKTLIVDEMFDHREEVEEHISDRLIYLRLTDYALNSD